MKLTAYHKNSPETATQVRQVGEKQKQNAMLDTWQLMYGDLYMWQQNLLEELATGDAVTVELQDGTQLLISAVKIGDEE